MITLDRLNDYEYVDVPALDLSELVKPYVDNIKEDFNTIGRNKFMLGYHLLELFKSKMYASGVFERGSYLGGKSVGTGVFRGNASQRAFLDFCSHNFDLDKSQVSRYINVVDEFGDGENGLKPEWQPFSWSQLVEMLPLTAEQRAEIKPTMTVKEIREYKNNLVATSQQTSDQSKDKPVATSQQQESEPEEPQVRKHFISYDDFPVSDSLHYIRFYGKTVQFVCDRVLELEKQNSDLTKKLEQQSALSVAMYDVMDETDPSVYE